MREALGICSPAASFRLKAEATQAVDDTLVSQRPRRRIAQGF
jgi:hypothetical protein